MVVPYLIVLGVWLMMREGESSAGRGISLQVGSREIPKPLRKNTRMMLVAEAIIPIKNIDITSNFFLVLIRNR